MVYSKTWTPWDNPKGYEGVLIFQVSLHANGCFITITKSPD